MKPFCVTLSFNIGHASHEFFDDWDKALQYAMGYLTANKGQLALGVTSVKIGTTV